MRDSWLCEHDIGAIGASEPFKVCTEVHTFVGCCAAQHARVWSISARLQEHYKQSGRRDSNPRHSAWKADALVKEPLENKTHLNAASWGSTMSPTVVTTIPT